MTIKGIIKKLENKEDLTFEEKEVYVKNYIWKLVYLENDFNINESKKFTIGDNEYSQKELSHISIWDKVHTLTEKDYRDSLLCLFNDIMIDFNKKEKVEEAFEIKYNFDKKTIEIPMRFITDLKGSFTGLGRIRKGSHDIVIMETLDPDHYTDMTIKFNLNENSFSKIDLDSMEDEYTYYKDLRNKEFIYFYENDNSKRNYKKHIKALLMKEFYKDNEYRLHSYYIATYEGKDYGTFGWNQHMREAFEIKDNKLVVIEDKVFKSKLLSFCSSTKNSNFVQRI